MSKIQCDHSYDVKFRKKFVYLLEPLPDDSRNEVSQEKKCKLSKVFLDISMPAEGKNLGRLVIELRSDIVPKTCKNFETLCRCTASGKCYRGTKFHRIIPGCYCQGGDVELNNGGGCSVSSYDGNFHDESFLLRHSRAGIVSTALPLRPNSNAAQFMITGGPVPWMDGICVPFGELVDGYQTLQTMMSYGSQSGKVRSNIIITDCGKL